MDTDPRLAMPVTIAILAQGHRIEGPNIRQPKIRSLRVKPRLISPTADCPLNPALCLCHLYGRLRVWHMTRVE